MKRMTIKPLLHISCMSALFAASAFALAQPAGYTGPSNTVPATTAGYAGPSSVALMTAREVLAKAKDDQYVKLKGKLTSHKGGEDYEFTDASGKLTVEIDARHFPPGARIDHTTLVELTGEFDKETFGESTVDVKQVKVVAN